jgi:hypothetical protein
MYIKAHENGYNLLLNLQILIRGSFSYTWVYVLKTIRSRTPIATSASAEKNHDQDCASDKDARYSSSNTIKIPGNVHDV